MFSENKKEKINSILEKPKVGLISKKG